MIFFEHDRKHDIKIAPGKTDNDFFDNTLVFLPRMNLKGHISLV